MQITLAKRGSLRSEMGPIATKIGRPPHVCFALDSDRTADIQDRQLRADYGHRRALNQCASLHGGALQVGTDDKRTAVVLSQIGNGFVDVEQAQMTHDEPSDGRLLRNATDDRGRCV
jgi:hypothetical protein